MSKSRILGCVLGVAALSLLLSASASAETLARQSGAFGIVTYDPPPVTETQTTPVPVPYAWLDAHVPEVVHDYEAYEAAAKTTAANGRPVWECYVAGLDPTNETSKFTAFISLSNRIPYITWSPNLNTNGIERIYTVLGKTNLTDTVEWAPTNSAHRFFKVKVEMP